MAVASTTSVLAPTHLREHGGGGRRGGPGRCGGCQEGARGRGRWRDGTSAESLGFHRSGGEVSMSSGTVRAALYARVSSEQQAQAGTIDSQLEALRRRVAEEGLRIEGEMEFVDEGYSGATLVRPGLERLRDMAAAGCVDRLYVHSPDRLARKYAYQVLLVDELSRCAVEVVFLNHGVGDSPEDSLLLQVQGMVAEYERAKILERSRRGKLHAARKGGGRGLSGARYGYGCL